MCVNSAVFGIISRPLRQKDWALICEGFDFRAAQGPGAPVPRDGPWRSGREESSEGAPGVAGPSDFEAQEAPEYIDVEIRLPWAPAHLVAPFNRGRKWNKVSFRPGRHRSALRMPRTYRRNSFEQDTRSSSPLMFYMPIEVPGTVTDPKARSSRHTAPSRPSDANAEQWRDTQDERHDDDWSNQWGGRNQFSAEDWKVWGHRQEDKKEEADRVGRNRRISDRNEQARKEEEIEKKKRRRARRNRRRRLFRSQILLLSLRLLRLPQCRNPLDPSESQNGTFLSPRISAESSSRFPKVTPEVDPVTSEAPPVVAPA